MLEDDELIALGPKELGRLLLMANSLLSETAAELTRTGTVSDVDVATSRIHSVMRAADSVWRYLRSQRSGMFIPKKISMGFSDKLVSKVRELLLEPTTTAIKAFDSTLCDMLVVVRKLQEKHHPVTVLLMGEIYSPSKTLLEEAIERGGIFRGQTACIGLTKLMRPGDRKLFTFRPQSPVFAGSWISVIGPGLICDVKVGSYSQFSDSLIKSTVCRVSDSVQVGQELHVNVEYCDGQNEVSF